MKSCVTAGSSAAPILHLAVVHLLLLGGAPELIGPAQAVVGGEDRGIQTAQMVAQRLRVFRRKGERLDRVVRRKHAGEQARGVVRSDRPFVAAVDRGLFPAVGKRQRHPASSRSRPRSSRNRANSSRCHCTYAAASVSRRTSCVPSLNRRSPSDRACARSRLRSARRSLRCAGRSAAATPSRRKASAAPASAAEPSGFDRIFQTAAKVAGEIGHVWGLSAQKRGRTGPLASAARMVARTPSSHASTDAASFRVPGAGRVIGWACGCNRSAASSSAALRARLQPAR